MDRNKAYRGRTLRIAVLIAVFAVVATAVISASGSNGGSQVFKNSGNIKQEENYKIDEYLRELVKTQTSDVNLPVVVVLKEQPAHDVSLKVKKKYEKQFEEITKPAKEIYARIKPLIGSQSELKGRNVSELVAREQSLLTGQEKSVLKDVGKNREAKTREMRREIFSQTAPLANKTQAPVIEKIKAKGGTIKYSSNIFNAIAADIPVSYIDELSKDSGVYKIYHDYVLNASLDVSTQAMGANTWWSNGYTGSVMDVAVVDTGIDGSHPALSVDYSGVFHATGATDPGYADDSSSTDDFQGHGTHVAGIVASTDSTYRGVAYGIDKLINAKAGWKGTDGRGYMYWSDGMQAIDWSLFGNADDADVISLSFGGGSTNGNSGFEHFLDAIAYSLDIPVVVAAGNGGPGSGSVGEPAGAFNILGVGNVDDKNTVSRSDDDLRASSSRGPTLDGRIKPDISAPGTSITSAYYNWEGTNPDFVSMTGTSMAAPHIAGSILLILDYENIRWQPEAIKALLLNTAEDKGAAGPDNDYGFGYVDLSNAYIHRDDVSTGSIGDSPDGSVEKFYKGTANNGDKATLVWNRHVTYNGPDYPTSNLSMSDLDLYMYDEANGSQISSSTSAINNVEQVMSNAYYNSIVLKIEPYGTFPSGITQEDFSLAKEEGFVEVNPPILNVNVINPGSIDSGANFNLDVNVTNSGGITAHGVTANISLPAGFTIVSGASPQSLGNISAGGSSTASWLVKAPGVSESTFSSLNVSASSFSYGESYSGNGSNSTNLTPIPPQTLAVCPIGCNYTNIQAAINAANDGDTINVAAGTYNENVDVNKSVNLVGAGADVTIVNASDPNDHVFYITASRANIIGFTVTGGTGGGHSIRSAGIFLAMTNYTNISNVNASNNFNGIYIFSAINSNLTGNIVNSNSYGIYLIFSSKNIITNNTAKSNSNYGIYLASSSNNTIYNNLFNNTYDSGNSGNNSNAWNTTKQEGANIIGGFYLGGNFWANLNGTGFSQTCTDVNIDGICNLSYMLASENADFLPLAVPSGYINGTVLDNGTGIAGAIVSTNSGVLTTTNASGFYSLQLPDSAYNLTAASEPGYYSNNSIIVTVVVGATVMQDIELLKKPLGTISGVVTNA